MLQVLPLVFFHSSLIRDIIWILLWNALDTDNFSFLLFNFSDFILDNKEAHDIAVTWHVTWYNIIGLEHGRRI